MTKAKITLADFAKSTELQEHARKSRAVARALDAIGLDIRVDFVHHGCNR